jgi:hypothetical protein
MGGACSKHRLYETTKFLSENLKGRYDLEILGMDEKPFNLPSMQTTLNNKYTHSQ